MECISQYLMNGPTSWYHRGLAVEGYNFTWITMAEPGLFGAGQCNARYNESVPCEDEYIPSEGMCLTHACLFDYWLSDVNGHRVYEFKKEHSSDSLDKWRRRQFYKWLDTLNAGDVKQILNS